MTSAETIEYFRQLPSVECYLSFEFNHQARKTVFVILDFNMKSYFLLLTHLLLSTITLVTLEPIERPIRRKPANCVDVLHQGYKESGIYTIYPWAGKYNFSVFCDMDTDGGGWIIFQRRDDYEPRQSFRQYWDAYTKGFGDLSKEFWLGNHYLYLLTNQDYTSLRIDLEDFEGGKRYAYYADFHISDCQDRYKLRVNRYYGDAGDRLAFHNGASFFTPDNEGEKKCASGYNAGWWFGTAYCHEANLNGLYLKGNTTLDYKGVHWDSYSGAKYSLKKSEMKFRPAYFP